uniref:Uncharacterized protein n=1 Tax=Panagrolaimus sp. PS1159 TaxID=55785 RepID=A0AC35FBU1_9BILA
MLQAETKKQKMRSKKKLEGHENLSASDSQENATTTVLPSDVPDFSIPCKVPTFVKILPISFRRQMRKIWSGVPMNSDCGKQLASTRELINTLPTSLKFKIAEFAEIEDKYRVNFFAELLPEEKAEFGIILKNMSLTATEKTEVLREWGREKLSVAAFENFEEYLSVFLEKDKKFQEKVKNLCPEARKAYERIQEIRREKQTLLSNLSEKAKKELASLFRSECSGHGPHSMAIKVQRDENNKQKEDIVDSELRCFGVPLSLPISMYTSLTKRYGREPPSSTPTIPSKTTITTPFNPILLPSQPSTGQKLFSLLLQRVKYLKPPQN